MQGSGWRSSVLLEPSTREAMDYQVTKEQV